MGSFRRTGIGMNSSTPMRLNKKCTMAMLIAAEVFVCRMAAMNAVMVVPTLAPMMNGAACLRLTILFATMGTTTDVVIELERIAAVVSRPQEKDLNGLLKKKRLNTSGLLAFNKSDISLRKMSMDAKSRRIASTTRMKGLFTISMSQFVTNENPDQLCVSTLST